VRLAGVIWTILGKAMEIFLSYHPIKNPTWNLLVVILLPSIAYLVTAAILCGDYFEYRRSRKRDWQQMIEPVEIVREDMVGTGVVISISSGI
jgi:hypothetical protein